MCHPLMIMKFRIGMNNTQKPLIMKRQKKITFKKKTPMSLKVEATQTKIMIALMIMSKYQVEKRLEKIKREMIKKIKITTTLEEMSLVKYYTLLIASKWKLKTMIMLKEQQVMTKTHKVENMS